MNFDDLKDQLKESWNQLVQQVQENPTFNTLVEKYETLPSEAQRGIVAGVLFLVALFLFSIPMSYLSSADEKMQSFEDHKTVIRDLLKISQSPKPPMEFVNVLPLAQLKQRIAGLSQRLNLLPEQHEPVKDISLNPAKSFAPPGMEQQALAVSYKQLNLQQLTDIAYKLQSIAAAVKVTAMNINKDKEKDHYYNANFELVRYSLANNDNKSPERKSKFRKRK